MFLGSNFRFGTRFSLDFPDFFQVFLLESVEYIAQKLREHYAFSTVAGMMYAIIQGFYMGLIHDVDFQYFLFLNSNFYDAHGHFFQIFGERRK